MKLLLEGGRVLCPGSGEDRQADVLVEDGLITAVGGFEADGVDAERLDCTGRVVSPALVDLEANLCDPGMPWREDLVSGSAAAAAGGFTTVLASPATDPVLDEPSTVREVLERAATEASIEVRVAAALTVGLAGAEVAEVGLLVEAGASALSNAGAFVENTAVLRYMILYARSFGCPILLRAGDPWLEGGGVMHEGEISARIGLRGTPDASEEIGVSRLAALSRLTHTPLHITGVTTAKGVDQLRAAQESGVAVTASTSAHHLLLSDTAVLESGYDSSTRLSPPLRSESDRLAMVQAVKDGVVGSVTSQHEPWTRVEKELEFERAQPGAVGLDTALSATVEALGGLEPALRALSLRPGKFLGLDRRLAPGLPAEIVVLDPGASWTVDASELASRCGNTPLLGRELSVRVSTTIHKGRPVHHAKTG
jgi:dihydroorotase